MATLLKNVFAAEQWWGPDYGNADAVPAVVAAAMDLNLFDEPPGPDDVHAEPTPPPHVAGEPSQSDEPTGESLVKPQPVDGFGWLAHSDAQAAVELLEENALSHIDDNADGDPVPAGAPVSGNGDTP